MKDLSDLEVGKAGEHLVCYDLIMKGHLAMLSDQGLQFDIVAVVNGKLIKIQVKATREAMVLPQRSGDYKNYLFNVRRCGKGGRQNYLENDVDIFAFACLSTKEIGYVAAIDSVQTMIFRADTHRGTYYDEIMVSRGKRIKEMSAQGVKNSDIAKELGLNKSYVGKVISKQEDNHIKGRYLVDCTFEIACRRIEDAQRMGDMFAAPEIIKPTQTGLDL